MPAARTKKGDAPNASAMANDASKMSSGPVKRKRRPGEQRYYAVRAGKIPGVYMSWAECQAMTNGFAGANCELLNNPWTPPPQGTSIKPPTFPQQPSCRPCFATDKAVSNRQVLQHARGGPALRGWQESQPRHRTDPFLRSRDRQQARCIHRME